MCAPADTGLNLDDKGYRSLDNTLVHDTILYLILFSLKEEHRLRVFDRVLRRVDALQREEVIRMEKIV
jgi:hypothetical protein